MVWKHQKLLQASQTLFHLVFISEKLKKPNYDIWKQKEKINHHFL